MSNPWEKVSLEDYEGHMKSSTVHQIQELNEIMKSQMYKYKVKTIAILGVAGGNGLEHIDSSRIKNAYGIDIFIKQLSKNSPRYVSCVIQKNPDTTFVSDSPYVGAFDKVSELHRDIEKKSLVEAMDTIEYNLIFSEEHLLPNMKKFIRMDFIYS